MKLPAESILCRRQDVLQSETGCHSETLYLLLVLTYFLGLRLTNAATFRGRAGGARDVHRRKVWFLAFRCTQRVAMAGAGARSGGGHGIDPTAPSATSGPCSVPSTEASDSTIPPGSKTCTQTGETKVIGGDALRKGAFFPRPSPGRRCLPRLRLDGRRPPRHLRIV